MELSPMVWAGLLGRVEDLLRGQGLVLADITALATMRQACRQRLGIDGSTPDARRQLQDAPTPKKAVPVGGCIHTNPGACDYPDCGCPMPEREGWRRPLAVHALLGDYAVCGFSQLPFIDWPENHRSTRNVAEVTCTNCRRRL